MTSCNPFVFQIKSSQRAAELEKHLQSISEQSEMSTIDRSNFQRTIKKLERKVNELEAQISSEHTNATHYQEQVYFPLFLNNTYLLTVVNYLI